MQQAKALKMAPKKFASFDEKLFFRFNKRNKSLLVEISVWPDGKIICSTLVIYSNLNFKDDRNEAESNETQQKNFYLASEILRFGEKF